MNAPFLFTWPVLTNQFSNLLRSNYKFSFHTRAQLSSKKLTSIRLDVHNEVRDNAVSQILWIDQGSSLSQKPVSFDSGSRYVRYFAIVISVWFHGYSKCSETNVYIMERMKCSEYRLHQKVPSGDSRVCLYWYSVTFWTATVLTFLKNGLQLFRGYFEMIL